MRTILGFLGLTLATSACAESVRAPLAPLGPPVLLALQSTTLPGPSPVRPKLAFSRMVGAGAHLEPLRHAERVLCLDYSDDGRYLITGSSDGAILWDASAGAAIRWVVRDWVEQCQFASDGTIVLRLPIAGLQLRPRRITPSAKL